MTTIKHFTLCALLLCSALVYNSCTKDEYLDGEDPSQPPTTPPTVEQVFHVDMPAVVLYANDYGSTTTITGYSLDEWVCEVESSTTDRITIATGSESGASGEFAITIKVPDNKRGATGTEHSAVIRVTSGKGGENEESLTVKAILPSRISSATASDVDATYKYWPSYNYQTDLSYITQDVWLPTNHAVKGWDFSSRPSTAVSSRSQFYTDRSMAYGQAVDNVSQTSLRINPSCEMWVTWKDIEPDEDDYQWDDLKTEIQKIRNQGYTNIALRILTSGYKRRSGTSNPYQRSLGYAPLWLDDYLRQGTDNPDDESYTFDFTKNTAVNSDFLIFDGWDSDNGVVVCYDPENATFHQYYQELVESFAENGMADLVDAAYIGYGYRSHGEEYICKHGTLPDGNQTVKERLDVWQRAFAGQEHKIYMGGSTDYGFAYGFGVRRGYVEKYWYTIPDLSIGQQITDNGHLWVNEDCYVIQEQAFNGEVNEEYAESWSSSYGDTSTFPYRYFMSMMRTLQMRCTAVIVDGNLIPEMLPFISLQLARTIEDTPDIWSFMTQSTLKSSALSFTDYDGTVHSYDSDTEVKHFERWLYQRDKEGYETVPTMAIKQPDNMSSWCADGYDYIARRGARIGFYADSRFKSGRKAVKVTYLDNSSTGSIAIRYTSTSGEESVASRALTGDGELRTATYILDDIKLGNAGYSDSTINAATVDYDFTIEAVDGAETVTVSMVRVITL